MVNGHHICFSASDRSYFAILKKEIHKLVADAGFNETKVGEIDLIVAEMTSNLVKHASDGELLVRIFEDDGVEVAELISIDNGPGMAEPLRMLEDGISTSNTLGHGLGSIKRLSNVFQIYSLKNWGTIVLSRVYKKDPAPHQKKKAVEVGVIVVPKPGEEACGDGIYVSHTPERLLMFLGDGLGHGPDAEAAVQAAVDALKNTEETSTCDIIRHLHKSVKKTRGLVGSIAICNFREKKWRICGVGNVNTRTHGTAYKNHISYNGIIGMNIPATLNEQIVPYERGQCIIMCSDGIKTRWDLQKHTNIFRYDPTIAAAAIYKDFSRKTDDTSVLITRINA